VDECPDGLNATNGNYCQIIHKKKRWWWWW
jgi:hypothetical protein